MAMRAPSGEALGAAGLLATVLGLALAAYGVGSGHDLATVAGIVLTVAGLVGLRAWTWVRKERVLRRVGRDLHVPPDDD